MIAAEFSLMSCIWTLFLTGSHTMPGQPHSWPTCHLHVWQNDRGLFRATAVTLGWNEHWIRVSTQSQKSVCSHSNCLFCVTIVWWWIRAFSETEVRSSITAYLNAAPFWGWQCQVIYRHPLPQNLLQSELSSIKSLFIDNMMLNKSKKRIWRTENVQYLCTVN